ncbi:hypothetical protein [Lacipirellula sp.]|uniref:hypothetical protein n=1 Tax=Lacipirellula sp. TaxID=2691419 RepID=UPI003D0B47EC
MRQHNSNPESKFRLMSPKTRNATQFDRDISGTWRRQRNFNLDNTFRFVSPKMRKAIRSDSEATWRTNQLRINEKQKCGGQGAVGSGQYQSLTAPVLAISDNSRDSRATPRISRRKQAFTTDRIPHPSFTP